LRQNAIHDTGSISSLRCLGGWEIYLLLEMQSSVDFRMPYRLLLYQVEIWRYLLQNEEDALSNRKTFQLPPIIPIVLYNGK
jgi:hypothetical protein